MVIAFSRAPVFPLVGCGANDCRFNLRLASVGAAIPRPLRAQMVRKILIRGQE
jgi:hypothetical protein